MDRKLQTGLKRAVKHFWATRDRQSSAQGTSSGRKDTGSRSAVTGGKHLDGFTELCRGICIEAGIPDAEVFWKSKRKLPGFYRAEKDWDLIVVAGEQLLAVLEFKAQVGPSFGNNFNNRTEEALGNATDLWAAYREGAFKPSPRPWLGYLFLIEDCAKSNAAVKVQAPHFDVFPEFQEASYVERYEILLTKLLRERLYDGACLILSTKQKGLKGGYRCPSEEIGFSAFAASLSSHLMSHARRC